MFFPEEVEDCINEFAGVTQSRVFGRPHARLGEIPCAEVVSGPGCDLIALKAHCARALLLLESAARVRRGGRDPPIAGREDPPAVIYLRRLLRLW